MPVYFLKACRVRCARPADRLAALLCLQFLVTAITKRLVTRVLAAAQINLAGFLGRKRNRLNPATLVRTVAVRQLLRPAAGAVGLLAGSFLDANRLRAVFRLGHTVPFPGE